MDIKKLSDMVLMLLSMPAKAWRVISRIEGRSAVLNEFLYPMIMLCCLSTLLGTFIVHDLSIDSFYYAMVKAGVQFATLFFAYHLLAFFVAKISTTYMKAEYDRQHTDSLTAYSMVVVLLLEILLALFPNFRIIGWILQFYTVKIVWDGAAVLMRVPEERRLTYTMAVSVLIIIMPVILGALMSGLYTNLG